MRQYVKLSFAFMVSLLFAVATSTTMIAQEATQENVKSDAAQFSPFVDQTGQIQLPSDYKTSWAHLGDWAVAKKKGLQPHELHEVYTQRESVQAYRNTGEFPDGTVLVKEVRHTRSDILNTGLATWAGDIKHWFVMVKDNANRFPDNPIWGDGWGWAFFDSTNPKKNTTVNYQISCIGCHIPAESTDWVFVQGYPELKKPER